MKTRVLQLDREVYSADAVKKACYRYLDRFSARIETTGSHILCHLSFADSKTEEGMDGAVSELEKEVLDQDLRERIGRETAAVRNLILSHAFSKTDLIKDE